MSITCEEAVAYVNEPNYQVAPARPTVRTQVTLILSSARNKQSQFAAID